MQAWIMWLIVAVLAFILEAMTAGLTTLWFGVSALVVSLLSALLGGVFKDAGWFIIVQLVVFVALSALLLVLTRPISKKLMKPKETNAPAVIGKRAVVLERIDNIEGSGQIKLNGNVWTARSENDDVIEKGEMVEVKAIAGVSAIVKRKEGE